MSAYINPHIRPVRPRVTTTHGSTTVSVTNQASLEYGLFDTPDNHMDDWAPVCGFRRTLTSTTSTSQSCSTDYFSSSVASSSELGYSSSIASTRTSRHTSSLHQPSFGGVQTSSSSCSIFRVSRLASRPSSSTDQSARTDGRIRIALSRGWACSGHTNTDTHTTAQHTT